MTDTIENEWGFEDIIAKLIEKIDRLSIKNSLKDSIIIDKITSEVVYIITINKVAQLIFSNKEHMRYIEDKLSEVLGNPVNIQVTFENKDSYFARKIERT